MLTYNRLRRLEAAFGSFNNFTPEVIKDLIQSHFEALNRLALAEKVVEAVKNYNPHPVTMGVEWGNIQKALAAYKMEV